MFIWFEGWFDGGFEDGLKHGFEVLKITIFCGIRTTILSGLKLRLHISLIKVATF